MGIDESRHYFLPKGSNIIRNMAAGSYTKMKMLDLAPLSAWMVSFPSKNGAFNVDSAADFLIRESEKVGFFKPKKVRGAGVWIDNDEIIINDGEKLCDKDGLKIDLGKFESKYFYIKSDKEMGDFAGRVATEKEGTDLVNLFMSQGFETELQAFIALGWSLIAPFGGILKWRPHIWLTGPKGSGKTYILENFIWPLTGPFTFIGTGEDSAPGLYRSLWRDPCPVIKDEMEPGEAKETKLKISQTLEVVRNASADFSANKTVAKMGGGVDRFCIRSCFCLSSVVPYMPGGAIESRILISRLKKLSFVKGKFENTKNILKTGLMSDPGIFRRKIYKCLPTVIKNIELLRIIISGQMGDQRQADNLAPIFAAIFALIGGDKIIDIEKITELLKNLISGNIKNEDGNDEDKLLYELFDHSVRVETENISIAELIMYSADETNSNRDYKKTLLRLGIKIHKRKTDDKKFLAIARSHTAIDKILYNSMYSGRYVEVLKRHESINEINHSVRFAGQIKNAILLDWDLIKEKYFSYEEKTDQMDLFNDVI